MTEYILFAINAVGPVLLLISLGILLQRVGMFPREFFEAGNKLVFKVLIPCAAYCNIYACPSLADVNFSFMLYGAGIACVIFLLGLVMTHLFVREKISQSAAHQCTFLYKYSGLGGRASNVVSRNRRGNFDGDFYDGDCSAFKCIRGHNADRT